MFDVRSKSKAMRLRNGLCKTFTNRVIFGPDGCRENGSRQPSGPNITRFVNRSEEHTSELQSRLHIVYRLLLEKKKKKKKKIKTYIKLKILKNIKKDKTNHKKTNKSNTAPTPTHKSGSILKSTHIRSRIT